jgi:transcriptional regulator
MQIYDFTVPELNKFRELCNFSDDELEYFNLRSRHKSNVEIAMAMHVSEAQVSKLARKVKDKIKRIV